MDDDHDLFDPEVTVTYDLPDSTVEVYIDVHPHNGAAYDLQHMSFIASLRESVTTFCQLHHHYRQTPELLYHSDGPVGAVKYYTELAFAHSMIDALQEDRASTDLTRRVLLLNQLVESLNIAARRNPTIAQAAATAHYALQLAEEFDIAGSIDCIQGMDRTIPRDLGRFLPSDPEEQRGDEGKWVRQLRQLNDDCQDYPYFVFVDDTQTAEEHEQADFLDDKNKLIINISDDRLRWEHVHDGRRIFPHTV
ncbi:hypothetical protein [Corynebacterium crudilactis]|uniref:Uncharacterized protein n=1 Tax=Corynebacterium crudilactis TaxID=1652495 RepID=A0A172QQ76_9CORY|nr:hypothetical protein [Corynebacterium crudilactis]ANE02837.1 hypothetical protein ccrud_00395 [Corynebacterium crudilactis]